MTRKTNLSKYIAAVKKGQKIYIRGYRKPEVALVALTPHESKTFNEQAFTVAKGKVTGQMMKPSLIKPSKPSLHFSWTNKLALASKDFMTPEIRDCE